jgi:DMSO reductase anchor subunit
LLLIVILVSGQGMLSVAASVLAVIGFVCGILTERWLFFAEARHAVMNYYGQ